MKQGGELMNKMRIERKQISVWFRIADIIRLYKWCAKFNITASEFIREATLQAMEALENGSDEDVSDGN